MTFDYELSTRIPHEMRSAVTSRPPHLYVCSPTQEGIVLNRDEEWTGPVTRSLSILPRV